MDQLFRHGRHPPVAQIDTGHYLVSGRIAADGVPLLFAPWTSAALQYDGP